MRMKSKKVISFLLVLFMTISLFPLHTFSADEPLPLINQKEEEKMGIVQAEGYAYASADTAASGKSIDVTALKTYLEEKLSACEQYIDVSGFGLAVDDIGIVTSIIYRELPLIFHPARTYQYSYSGQTLTGLLITYEYTYEAYQKLRGEVIAAADTILEGIENNSDLTDMEKALLLHDRLAAWTEYDIPNLQNGTLPRSAYEIHGALVNKLCVCEGYTMAYMYLLDRVGIKNTYTNSEQLDHIWNIVYIDDIPYHVDVTWDDGYISGEILHTNFLVSSKKLYAEGHKASDYETYPTDTRYDNAFWRNSRTEFQLLDGVIYYIDNQKQTLNTYIDGASTAIHDVSSRWDASPSSYWEPRYARLSASDSLLLYSGSRNIYAYDPKTDSSRVVFHPKEVNEGFTRIYGFAYVDGYLICDLYNSPNHYYKKYTRITHKDSMAGLAVTDLVIESMPNKLLYYLGDPLETAGLQVKVMYEDGSERYLTEKDNYSITGYSQNEVGEYVITIAYAGKTATFTVTVKKPTIVLSEKFMTLKVGESAELFATVTPEAQEIIWSSSVSAYAECKDGKVIALFPGKVTIKAGFNYQGRYYQTTCDVTIVPNYKTVSGNIKAPGNDKPVTITVKRDEHTVLSVLTIPDADYSLQLVPGDYILEISKPGHIARKYKITVGDTDITQDIELGLLGDLTDGSENTPDVVDDEDAIYLLLHTYFPDKYELNQNGDYDKNGVVDADDAIYLLLHSYFPDEYPL